MTQKELLNKIKEMKLAREFALISFTNQKDIFFQYFGSTHLPLDQFIAFNFEIMNIEKIIKVQQSPLNPDCVIVEVA